MRGVALDTLRALRGHDCGLAAYCPTCDRWSVLDLERPIAAGQRDYVGASRGAGTAAGPGSGNYERGT
jgi:hypothetical protein